MATSVVQLRSFDHEVFNSIPDYHKVRHLGDIDKNLSSMLPIINKFGDIFIKHGIEKFAGLTLIHRHFLLKAGEYKVAKQTENELHIGAIAFPGDDKLMSENINPYMFLPRDIGEKEVLDLYPLEFVHHLDLSNITQIKAEIEAIQNVAFLRDFHEVAKAEGVEGIYGIILHSRDNISFDKKFQTLIEGSGTDDRSLVVKVIPREELKGSDSTTVGWSFHKNCQGKVFPMAQCYSALHGESEGIHNCEGWNHCYHCEHGGGGGD